MEQVTKSKVPHVLVERMKKQILAFSSSMYGGGV